MASTYTEDQASAYRSSECLSMEAQIQIEPSSLGSNKITTARYQGKEGHGTSLQQSEKLDNSEQREPRLLLQATHFVLGARALIPASRN